MNLGLGNLLDLKQHLLAEQYRDDANFATALQALGSGVAAAFEKYCNRKFARTMGDTFITAADGEIYYLPRYPIEDLTTIELRTSITDGWVEQADAALTWEAASGRIQLYAPLGDYRSQVRFTYTGGYWWNTSEDVNAPDTQPAGAAALPDDLKLAWLLQCKKTWEVYDPTGTGIAKGGSSVQLVGLSLAGLELVPAVKEMLNPYRRLFS